MGRCRPHPHSPSPSSHSCLYPIPSTLPCLQCPRARHLCPLSGLDQTLTDFLSPALFVPLPPSPSTLLTPSSFSYLWSPSLSLSFFLSVCLSISPPAPSSFRCAISNSWEQVQRAVTVDGRRHVDSKLTVGGLKSRQLCHQPDLELGHATAMCFQAKQFDAVSDEALN